MKTCSRCGQCKPISEFHKKLDGFQPSCKVCVIEAGRKWREANREVDRERSRTYRSENPEKFRASLKRYYQANKPAAREYKRAWDAANPDKVRAQVMRKNARRRARLYGLPNEPVIFRDVAVRDGAHCWMCGDELCEYSPAHLDHLIPVSATNDGLEVWGLRNPGTVTANMALCCPACNLRKGARIMLCAVARYLVNASHDTEDRLEAA